MIGFLATSKPNFISKKLGFIGLQSLFSKDAFKCFTFLLVICRSPLIFELQCFQVFSFMVPPPEANSVSMAGNTPGSEGSRIMGALRLDDVNNLRAFYNEKQTMGTCENRNFQFERKREAVIGNGSV